MRKQRYVGFKSKKALIMFTIGAASGISGALANIETSEPWTYVLLVPGTILCWMAARCEKKFSNCAKE